jgi:Bardet-Biedl syndrome 1 protein
LNDDGDERLLIADQDRRLKVFKGTSMQSEHVLLSHPCAVCPFYADNNTPRTPAIGIASGPFIYIYRNLRPYYKFTLPPVDIASTEAETWSMLREDKYTADQVYLYLVTTIKATLY